MLGNKYHRLRVESQRLEFEADEDQMKSQDLSMTPNGLAGRWDADL